MTIPFLKVQTTDPTDSKEPLRSAPDLYGYLRFIATFSDISNCYYRFLSG
jgi:hypothetical protein